MHWSDPSHPSQSSASSVVEHLTFNQGVVSSSLTRGTTPYFLTLPPRASKQHLPEAEIASGFSFPARRFGEMVDARDLKSLEAIPHAGSSPATGTTKEESALIQYEICFKAFLYLHIGFEVSKRI